MKSALEHLPERLDELWADQRYSPRERRRILYELWLETDQTPAGRAGGGRHHRFRPAAPALRRCGRLFGRGAGGVSERASRTPLSSGNGLPAGTGAVGSGPHRACSRAPTSMRRLPWPAGPSPRRVGRWMNRHALEAVENAVRQETRQRRDDVAVAVAGLLPHEEAQAGAAGAGSTWRGSWPRRAGGALLRSRRACRWPCRTECSRRPR